METHGIIESFSDIEEAFHFLDHKILEFIAEGWTVREGSGIERMQTGKWRVGILLIKNKEGND